MIPVYKIEAQKAEAKKYIDRVIDIMALSDAGIKDIIRNNAKKLIEKSFSYKDLGSAFHFSANEDLDQITTDILRQTQRQIFNAIYMDCYNADAIAHEKENEKHTDKYLLAFLAMQVAGETIEDRISLYARQFRDEIEAYIAIGISKGLNPTQILNYYLTFFKNPLASPLILEAIRKQGYKAEVILQKGNLNKKNKYKSAHNNLVRLRQDSTMRAYNHAINSIWLNNQNIAGWYTVRGSSYPCAVCDDHIGEFHSKDEFFYGWHPRCCCIMLPIYITVLYETN
ncbi:hypothetical protein [Dysgonomonas sp. 25]|uniref:hypothetical protein n=1 Tax=Dysgonomonas sp. 25 TaxID=2302933 RepID=UPI0013D704B0|nr:hypothetical protein [Dysgonomonas sp. 25]NDV68606.1 hypothetical protein [Dysgonomonas sp. 25]